MHTSQQATLTPAVDDDDHRRGGEDALVTLVEYGDYQCPYTRSAERRVVGPVLDRLGERLRFVFRHCPLEDLHPLARGAAETAEAGAVQGRFWEVHGALFSHPERLAPADLLEHARGAGLDVARVERELAEHAHAPAVDADLDSARRSGVPGTPTFFVDGVRYDGPLDAGSLLAVLQRAAEDRTRPGSLDRAQG